MKKTDSKHENMIRKRNIRNKVFKMVSVGVVDEPVNQMYDILSISALLLNLGASVMATFNNLQAQYGDIFHIIEVVTVAFFAIDFVLRVYTAKCHFPKETEAGAIKKYIFSLDGIIDILSFLPYYLPFMFPNGAAAFKMFRVARILRLFRINAYYDSLNVITDVIKSKSQQLMSSVFIILVLMLGSSLCMYSLEHDAQPEVFSNAFSGVWWSMSTLLTVGYGDIYPVTTLGKFFGIIIAFLGVGIVAIPTGIISAGFVEQYTHLSTVGDSTDTELNFIQVKITKNDDWAGKYIKDLHLPDNIIIAALQRNNKTSIPKGNTLIHEGDQLVLGSEPLQKDKFINFKEMKLEYGHSWIGLRIDELDISRTTFIVMIRRGNKPLVPRGNLVLMEGDVLFLYSVTKAGIDL